MTHTLLTFDHRSDTNTETYDFSDFDRVKITKNIYLSCKDLEIVDLDKEQESSHRLSGASTASSSSTKSSDQHERTVTN